MCIHMYIHMHICMDGLARPSAPGSLGALHVRLSLRPSLYLVIILVKVMISIAVIVIVIIPTLN